MLPWKPWSYDEISARAVSELNSTRKNSTKLEIFVNLTQLELKIFQIKIQNSKILTYFTGKLDKNS